MNPEQELLQGGGQVEVGEWGGGGGAVGVRGEEGRCEAEQELALRWGLIRERGMGKPPGRGRLGNGLANKLALRWG